MDAILCSAPSIATLTPPHPFSSSFHGTRLQFSPSLPVVQGRETLKIVSADHGGRMMPVPNSSYAAPIESSSGAYMMRPLAEILRDMNKRVPDQVLKPKVGNGDQQKYIPWYQANRMLSFYAPGWCGEVRNITFSCDGKFATVIYRVTLRGSDGEAYREASGTVSMNDTEVGDPIQKAEALAFSRACARFGLGLYLHHEADEKNI